MQVGFEKLKNKIYRDAIIKTLIIACSMGMVVASIFLIIIKRCGWIDSYYFLYPISVLFSMGVAFVGGYFLLRPKDKEIAKRLDRELHLKQSVQTMVAFRQDEGALVALQREITDNKLQTVSKKQIKFKTLWVYILVGLISITSLISAFLIPVKDFGNNTNPGDNPNGPVYNDTWEFNEWMKVSLENLIQSVEDSDMVRGAKALVVEELQALLTEIAPIKKKSEMTTRVVSTMRSVDEIVDNHNTYFILHQELRITQHKTANLLAEALDAIDVQLGVVEDGVFNENFIKISNDLLGENTTLEDYKNTISNFSKNLLLAINVTQGKLLYADGEALYEENLALVEKLNAVVTKESESFTFVKAKEGIAEILNKAQSSFLDALYEQAKNLEIEHYVVEDLQQIFKIPTVDMPDLTNKRYASSAENGGNPEDFGGGGGYAGENPETLYRSDEMIYNPLTQEYVPYGEVYNAYKALIDEQILQGDIPEDIQKIIEIYFKYLEYQEDNGEKGLSN